MESLPNPSLEKDCGVHSVETEETPKATAHPQELAERIDKCNSELTSVVSNVIAIKTQSHLKRWWKRDGNIKTLAENLHVVAEVQEHTLTMIALISGAAIRMRRNYNTIITALDNMKDQYKDDEELREYVNQVRKLIVGLRRREWEYRILWGLVIFILCRMYFR